jgi:UDP-N-acetylglucosamine 4,6-dehydratase
MSYSFDGESVFISGGCGSLGSALATRLLKTGARRVVLFDNDQSRLGELERRFADNRVRYFVGDVRDLQRLKRAVEGCEIAFHCAALKIVPSCEYNPTEAIKTNVLGSQNFIEACLDTTPEIAVGISTDKACSPLNLYGATKLCMERLFIAANRFKGERKTVFTCVRYGNVLGSADSVIPVWKEQLAAEGKITVTNPNMTRFSITIDQATDFIFASMKYATGSEVFVPRLKSYTVDDLAAAFLSATSSNARVEKTGMRAGEKDHELLINEHELKYTREFPGGYIVAIDAGRETGRVPSALTHLSCYSSETAERLKVDELVALLKIEGVLTALER